MKLNLFFLSLTFGLASISLSAADNWESLFNGISLKGWEVVNGSAEFKVENGEIIGVSALKTPNTFLTTKKHYGDFILEYELLMEAEGMNSGVQIRSNIKADFANGMVHGLQVECDGSKRAWTGGIYDERRNGWLYSLEYNKEAKVLFQIGEWTSFRIEAVGNRVRTFINEKPVSDLLVDLDDAGFIGLQVHSIGNKDLAGKKMRWKNIRINTTNPADEMLPETKIEQVNYMDNKLSDREKAEGWKLLWDGETSNGWRSHKAPEFPKKGWDIVNGVLTVEKSDGGESTNGGDIITTTKYKNFVLEVDFKITEGANSGIKYFVDPDMNTGAGSAIGCEFQILDDKKHPDAKKGVNGNRTVGSLYDLISANGQDFNPYLKVKRMNGIGVWNRARIEVRDGQVIHFLNGSKIIEYDRSTQMWQALVAYSKYENWPNFGEAERGYILLQDHGDKVSFKNIKLKELD